VDHLTGGLVVVGSNPAAPTNSSILIGCHALVSSPGLTAILTAIRGRLARPSRPGTDAARRERERAFAVLRGSPDWGTGGRGFKSRRPDQISRSRVPSWHRHARRDARRAILARIRKRALLEGFTRREIPEYPDWAYREAIINAVAHRDYGISGAHIQIRLFSDRIEVQSPGGLLGMVSEENIEHEQSTRNHAVVRLLEDLSLVEQRGIGINQMVQSMLAAGLERPIFRDSLTSFLVVLKNHTMIDDEAYRWLATFADRRLTDSQRVGLVYTWRTGKIANRDYQRLNSVTSVAATRALRGLVEQGLLRQPRNARRRLLHVGGDPLGSWSPDTSTRCPRAADPRTRAHARSDHERRREGEL